MLVVQCVQRVEQTTKKAILLASFLCVSISDHFRPLLSVSVSLWRKVDARNVRLYTIRIGSTPTFFYFHLCI